MSNDRIFDEPILYQITVKGTLSSQWSDWFDGLTISAQANNKTDLVGSVTDQSALHGIFAKLRDLGLPILLVKRLEE